MMGSTMKKGLEFKFWGVRGTAPLSPPEITVYGGHTPCASITDCVREPIVIDVGTGAIRMGRQWGGRRDKPLRYHILITHFHLDHIMGLPFFPPLYDGDVELRFYAPAPEKETEAYLSGLMSGRFFPVDWKSTPARKVVTDITEKTFTLDSVRISSCPLNHPQGSIAYRFTREDRSIVMATDTEHPDNGCDRRLVDFCRGADVLVYDASFTPEEYSASKHGWGHSTWKAGTALALEAGVGKLILSHHNPRYPDAVLDEMIRMARETFPPTEGAREEE